MNGKESYFVLASVEKCTGCRACEVACFAAHQRGAAKTVGTVATPLIPNLYVTRTGAIKMPVQCHHCENAPCLQSCLPGALERRDGAVVVNGRKCIGCRNCALACPFGAIHIAEAALLPELAGHAPVYKCDLCQDREGGPACIAACPNEALRLVDSAEELRAKRIQASEASEALQNSLARGGQ
ncbi:MAG: 4Fe-4S dicluster domain-containing protein [Treponema sp.]|jgi:electron transport protein HydN|nr:4Fe-4S dicluster domain-containing protein [Treponema sp.]